jgi:hypothetical protein
MAALASSERRGSPVTAAQPEDLNEVR